MESRTNAQRLVSKLALVTLLPCHVCSLRGLATRPRGVDEGTIRCAEIVPWLTKVQFLSGLSLPFEFIFCELHLIRRGIC